MGRIYRNEVITENLLIGDRDTNISVGKATRDEHGNIVGLTMTPAMPIVGDPPTDAAASTIEIAAATMSLLGNNDLVLFEEHSFKKVASGAQAGEFTNVAGLATLISGLDGWTGAESSGKLRVTSDIKGEAFDGTVVTLRKTEAVTAGGDVSAKATATIAGTTLAQMANGDTVVFDGVTFTKATETAVNKNEWKNTAGLIDCIDAMTDWEAIASSADIVITAAADGAEGNDKVITVSIFKATASGADGVLMPAGTIIASSTYLYIAIEYGTWKRIALSSLV